MALNINLVFNRVLARDATVAEIAVFQALNATNSDAEVLKVIVNLPEVQNFIDPVVRMYQGAFGRVPDAGDPNGNTEAAFDSGGVSGFWANVNALRNGISIQALANAFVASQEFLNKYGSTAVTPALITSYYVNILDRLPSAQEVLNWQALNLTAAQILVGFTESIEFKAAADAAIDFLKEHLGEGLIPTGPLAGQLPAPPPPPPAPVLTLDVDATSVSEGGTVTFKLEGGAAGESFAYAISGVQAGDINVPLSGSVTLDAQGVAFLTVQVLNDNLTEGTETLALQVAGLNQGVQINDTSTTPLPLLVFKAGTDTLTGTAGDDDFSAQVEQTALLPIQTLNNTDQADGGDGRDTLTAQLVNPFTVPASLKSIEVVNLEGAPGFIVPPVVLDVINADSIDTLGIRAPINAITLNNLQTSLEQINLSDAPFGVTHTINHVGPALGGTDDILGISVSNVGSAATFTNLVLNSGAGTYDQMNISSGGGLLNSLLVNPVGGAAQPTLVTLTGNTALTINDFVTHGLGWNAKTIQEVDGSAMTASLVTSVGGTSGATAAVVKGGTVGDVLNVGTAANASLFGNGGDDLMDFFGPNNGGPSFSSKDGADGGEDTDTLRIRSDAGAVLAAGVGANIVATEIIQHFTIGLDGASADISVDMSRSGSAEIIDLAGDYDFQNATVTKLLDADLVRYSGFDVNNLTLVHADPDVLPDVVRLEMTGSSDIEGDLIVSNVVETVILNIVGNGNVNRIDGANQIDANMLVTGGGGALDIGLSDGSYDFAGGQVDARPFSGDLTIQLGINSQTVWTGSGSDRVILAADGNGQGDTINLDAGSADFVQFRVTTEDDNNALASYHHINGFSIADDVIEIAADLNGLDAFQEFDDTTNNLNNPASTIEFMDFVSGTNRNGLAEPTNFIKFVTPQDSTGDDFEDLFIEAIGLGTITVSVTTDDVLAMMYDLDNQQAVLFTVDAFGGDSINTIDDGDDISVLGTISMTVAQFNAFNASNLDFVA